MTTTVETKSGAETCTIEPFGPTYPALPSVAKWRKLADKRELTKEETKAYGRAAIEAFRKMQRDELQRCLPQRTASQAMCASGTWLTDGKALIKAVREQHARKLQADANADRARRSDDQIKAAYQAAMDAKRKAQVEAVAQTKPDVASKVVPLVAPVTAPAPRTASLSLLNADGSYNRGNIMREAHAIARMTRASFPAKSYHECLSDALRATWANARNAPLKAAA